MDNRGKGLFQLGDIVTWQASKKHKPHIGVVVEIVNYARHPSVCPTQAEITQHRALRKSDVVWMNLYKSGNWRDHESYVVEDDVGKRWWPRVGNLTLLKRKENDLPRQD